MTEFVLIHGIFFFLNSSAGSNSFTSQTDYWYRYIISIRERERQRERRRDEQGKKKVRKFNILNILYKYIKLYFA